MIQTLSDALVERGYHTLTPVQEAVTAPELDGADLLVSAQTGSGKTVGFGLAIGSTLLGEAGTLGPAAAPLALVVAPTRELAFQVMRELSWLYAKAGARVTSCVGGMDMRDERRALERGAHIVVGTPGRLRDHIQRGSLDMTGLRAVVLDEADEMLDLGFREDLEFMLGEAPEECRTLLFSATVPPMIATLAQRYQREAVRVTTQSDRSQHADIAYQALKVAAQDAENAIINVLRYHEAQNAIVFANTRASVNRLTARFANRGFAVVCLSGELSQTERSHALQAMRDGRARVCVATDVAARGIDLPNLELVIHAELPSNAEGLLHRSGRTGRAGRKGISALVVPPKALKRAERLLKSARVSAEWTTAPGAEEILRRDEERLLADPAWEGEITENEAEFAARLLAERSPQAVAAAYLRLYRTKHSAPEELAAPDARPASRERAPFGPSTWFALSVGRDDRAEPRWLLPLLCRAGGLDKDSIGAIRVQASETFVELAEASVPGFLAALGEGGLLEEGVTARKLDAAPEAGGARRAPRTEPRPPRSKPAQPAAPAARSDGGATSHERREAAGARPQERTAASKTRDAEVGGASGGDAGTGPAKRTPETRSGSAAKHARADAPTPRSKSGGPEKRSGSGPKYERAGKPAHRSKSGGPETRTGSGPKHARADAPAPRSKSGGPGKRSGSASAGGAAASDTSKRFTPPKRGPGEKAHQGKSNGAGGRGPKRPKR